MDTEDSFDDFLALNTTGSLHSSDLSPVEYSQGSTSLLDYDVLKTELNLILGFVLGVAAILVLTRLFFLVFSSRISSGRLESVAKVLEEQFVPMAVFLLVPSLLFNVIRCALEYLK